MSTAADATSYDTARVALLPARTGPYRIDGVWWPRTRDLRRELPPLLAALTSRSPEISRITLDRTTWPAAPRWIRVASHVVHIGYFSEGHRPGEICLVGYGVGRWDLVVVAPESPAGQAEPIVAALGLEPSPGLRTAV
jgi:hypothetical protein